MTSLWEAINESNQTNPNRNVYVDKVICYLEEHFTEPISLDSIAEEVFISKYYLARIFKQITGKSPYQYLTNLRISKAKELLALTDFPLTEIAEMSGFRDAKKLICAFKQRMSITPGEYRRMVKS